MVVLEAMSWACPVVVSQAGYCGIAAELNDGVNATLLSDPLDIKALFAAVTSLFVPEIYAQQQEAALAFSQQHLWSDAAKQYADLYKELAPK
jgi:glycosyltransferase involved in cell wall biosynthesis